MKVLEIDFQQGIETILTVNNWILIFQEIIFSFQMVKETIKNKEIIILKI
jgi:hypothetical protein